MQQAEEGVVDPRKYIYCWSERQAESI